MKNPKTVMLEEIMKCLDYYDVDYELLDDRKGGPYINIGDIKHTATRAQFWINERRCTIYMWVGMELGRWYTESMNSEYKQENNRGTNKENLLEFPGLFMAFDFIKSVMGDKEEADKEIMINNSNMDDYELAIYIKRKNP